MESLRKLRDSVIGVPESSVSIPHIVYIVKSLKDVEREIPNDEKLGAEIRKMVNTFTKHYNM